MLPTLISRKILATLEEEDLQRVLAANEPKHVQPILVAILGLSKQELLGYFASYLRTHDRFQLLLQSSALHAIYDGGLSGRTQRYNHLTCCGIIHSPLRFARKSKASQAIEEPTHYYPIDGDSVAFWNRVYHMERTLLRYKVGRLLNKHLVPQARQTHTACSAFIAGKSFRMEHQYARILLQHCFKSPCDKNRQLCR
jgi:hypothetical protein